MIYATVIVLSLIAIISIVVLRCYCPNDKIGKKNYSGSILSFILPLVGQLLSRFIYLDNPYEMLWLLIPIFWIPPLNLIPSYFILNNMNLC